MEDLTKGLREPVWMLIQGWVPSSKSAELVNASETQVWGRCRGMLPDTFPYYIELPDGGRVAGRATLRSVKVDQDGISWFGADISDMAQWGRDTWSSFLRQSTD